MWFGPRRWLLGILAGPIKPVYEICHLYTVKWYRQLYFGSSKKETNRENKERRGKAETPPAWFLNSKIDPTLFPVTTRRRAIQWSIRHGDLRAARTAFHRTELGNVRIGRSSVLLDASGSHGLVGLVTLPYLELILGNREREILKPQKHLYALVRSALVL